MTPKLSQNQKQRKWKLFNYISKAQNSFRTLPNPKISPLGPQKVENDPKIKSKSKVRIERNTENESCSITWVDPKTFFEPYPNPKNSLLGPPKSQKLPQNWAKTNIRIDGNIQNESCSVTWIDPKTVVEPYPNPKNSPVGPRK